MGCGSASVKFAIVTQFFAKSIMIWRIDIFSSVFSREHEFSYDPDPFHHYAKAGKMRSGARPKFDVLLSSYEMVNVDNTALSSINWEMLIVDEAHRLKSQQSLVSWSSSLR